MYCLKNIDAAKIPNDIIYKYLELYKFIGRNQDMVKIVDKDFKTLVRQTIRTDAYFLSKHLNLSLKDVRLRRILEKGVQAQTKDERLLKHIKEALEKIHQETETFELTDRELLDLLQFLGDGVEPPAKLQYAKSDTGDAPASLLSSGQKTKREALEKLIAKYKEMLGKERFEDGFLAINFYIDFVNLKPFRALNETIGLIVLYILLITRGYAGFHLSSFFEKLFKRGETFQKHRTDASHNWSEGLSDTIGIHRFIVNIALETYKDVHEMLRNYTFDQELNKSDYVESTIQRLDEVFTKEDIRRAHPTISDSTIDRTLRRLRDDKKIRPLGKGRSAKWMKLMPGKKKKSIHEQLDLKL